MKGKHDITAGITGEQTLVVTPDVTITSLDASLPSVFATPAMINMMEITAAGAIEPYLPDGWISVGVVVNVQHLAATPLGMNVRVLATVTDVDHRRITFSVEAYDDIEKIGEGTHIRALVDQTRFQRTIELKISQGGHHGNKTTRQ